MGTQIMLVRHGQVDAAWRDRIYGCLDVPLSDQGRQEARRAAASLAAEPIKAVLSSGLSRTRYGAAWIARTHQLEVRHDAALREIDRGEWCGLSFAELEAQVPGGMETWRKNAWDMRPDGGESMGDLAQRVWPVLDQLARDFPRRQVVAVVAHMHVLKAALAKAVGAADAMAQSIPTGAVMTLDWTAGGPVDLLGIETFGS